ncbi:MAG: signal recognition particle-docking protein FtsY [Eggerthellaceae bacterium]|nr:signal recognition particle-docking protein FtsY [Eggerthellaceae bacterium]
MVAWFEKMKAGLSKSREKLTEQINRLTFAGPEVDDNFWDDLEESLITSDIGARNADEIVEELKDLSKRKALPDATAVQEALSTMIAQRFTPGDDIFKQQPIVILLVGVNGSGKTTTCGKIAYSAQAAGRNVVLGAADTFRAAAIEQLEVWSKRANVPLIQRERGADPASVCYDTIEQAEAVGANLTLIDTAGRLHTSDDLMRELQKVVTVSRKRATCDVGVVLVIDATTGQNGLQQARVFNEALHLDGVILTKLDGTAKGGIALAISQELQLPIYKIGVGEALEDLREFDATDFARALTGAPSVE